jgi:hypothetical protein
MFRFTIRDVLWLTVVVALAGGWYVHYLRMAEQRDSLRAAVRSIPAELEKVNINVASQIHVGYDRWEAWVRVQPYWPTEYFDP